VDKRHVGEQAAFLASRIVLDTVSAAFSCVLFGLSASGAALSG
jgi:hypothetical protein